MSALAAVGWLLAVVLGAALYVLHGMLKATQAARDTYEKSRSEWSARYFAEENIGHAAGWAAAREAAARIFEERAEFHGRILAHWREKPESLPADLRDDMIEDKALGVQSDINDARLLRSALTIPEVFNDAVRAAEEGLRKDWRAEVDFWKDNCKKGHANYDRVTEELRAAKREINALQGKSGSDET